MALRLWKKKLPAREDKMLKNGFKTEEGVFDRQTFFTLYGFLNKELIVSVDYPLSTGKEADVYRATAGPRLREECEFVALKIFRVDTSDFARMQEYLHGDSRFQKVKHSKREVVNAWTRKEFKNLQLCQDAGVPAPKPYAFNKNVLLMEFMGEEGVPDSTLKDLKSTDPEKDCDTLIGYMRKLYHQKLVHADFSEFNVLVHGYPDYKLYLIDLGQAVVLDHPKSREFLERDVQNILKYFAGYGVQRDAEEVLKGIKG